MSAHHGVLDGKNGETEDMKRTFIGASGLLLVIVGGWVVAQETLPASGEALPASGTKQPAAKPTLAELYSYAIGHDMGMSFRSRDTPLNVESLIAGVQDGLSGANPKYDQATRGQSLQQLQILMSNKAMAQQQAAGTENQKLGEVFLAENKAKEGVIVTKSGLQYKVIQAGTGATPGLNDTVSCNYRGTLTDGTEFDASAKHGGPASFPVSGVIGGWTEALQLMKVGAKWQLFIPAELAYGNNPPGPPIQAGSTLVFDIELLGIK